MTESHPTDPRVTASQIVDAALIEIRTWSTDEVRQMMNEAVAAERARCAAWVRHWQDHAYQSTDVLRAIERGDDAW
jgi:hypothetical protein